MEAVMIFADSETAGRFKSALRDAVTASDAADCLDKLSSLRIGLLIVSMKLPGSAGLCADLRKRFDFPIITISASGEKADLLTGLSLGDDCVPPDCPPELLKARVNAKLRLARPRGDRRLPRSAARRAVWHGVNWRRESPPDSA